MNVILGGKHNLYMAALDVVAKTLIISGVNNFPLDKHSLVSVYDTTVSLPFVFTPILNFSWAYVAGLPVYTWTFSQVPAGSANTDTLSIVIDIPQNQSAFSVNEYQASKV